SWSGGTITGDGSLDVASGATFTLNGGVKFLGDRTFNNDGVIAWSAGDIQQLGFATINNSGVFDIQADVTLGNATVRQDGTSYTTTFNNVGTLLRSSSSGLARLGGASPFNFQSGFVDLNNDGIIDVRSGTLNLLGAFSQAGNLSVASGATFSRAAGFTNLGTIGGSGTIDVGSNTLVNEGTISPGGVNTLGTLTILGNVDLTSAGVLEIDLLSGGGGNGSLGGALQADQLAVSGSATLAGVLNVNEESTPASGASFNIISAASMTGGFDSDASSIPEGLNGAIVGGGTLYRLTQSGLVCSGVCWDGGAGTSDWSTAANWTGDLLPTASDLVYIDLVTGADVTLADSQTIAALFSASDNNLTILNGGSLTLTSTGDASQLNGGLTINPGGSLQSNADLTINGAYSQSGGSLSSTGAVTIAPLNGPVSISNGSVSGASLTISGDGEAIGGNGVTLNLATLTAGSGGLSINGKGAAVGVVINENSQLSSSGPISITGQGGLQPSGIGDGVFIKDSTLTATSPAAPITINGSAGASGEKGVWITGNSTINANGSGDALVVNAGSGSFVNQAGSTVFNVSGGGRWLLYSGSPLNDSLGGLTFAFKQYNKTFSDGKAILGSGNGVLYAINPSVSASLVNVTKVYDGTSTALVTPANLPVSGAIDGDVVVISALFAQYTSAGTSPIVNAGPEDVGTDKVVSASTTITSASSSAAQGNVPVYGYTLATPSVSSGSGVITPKPITISGIAGVNTTYGTPAPTGNVALSGAISGDLVSSSASIVNSLNSSSGNLRAGSYAQTATALFGADAANYSLSGSFTTSSNNYVVAPLALSISGIAGVNTTYGTTAPTGNVALSGAIGGDQVSSSASIVNPLNSSSENLSAGSYAQTATALFGADAANYSLSGSFTTDTNNYVVSPLALLISGITASDKIYDGTTTATLLNVPNPPAGVIAGDEVTLTATGSFDNRNVGTAKPVAISSSVGGTDAANYLVTPQTGTTASITIRDLATWQSSSGGNWSNAANWDYLPDGVNVAAVLIPSSSGPVVFDAAVGATSLQSLTNQGSLAVNAAGLSSGQLINSGALSLGTDLSLSGLSGQPTFSQSGGSLGGPANLTLLAGSGSWSGGLWNGGGEVLLSPGTSFAISGDSTQWGGRSLVVQGASGPLPAATLSISGTTTAIAGSNAILNAGVTSLSGASLNESAGSLNLSNSGSLLASGSNSLSAGFVNSGGVQVNSGSLALSGSGSDSGGSYQVADGAELVWSGGSRNLNGGTAYSSSGSGRFRLAGASLSSSSALPLAFNGQLLVQSGSLSGTSGGSLSVSGGYGQSGGQINGFSSVVINQLSGPLQISGSDINQTSIATADGGSISLNAAAGAITLSNTGLEARGSSSGGTISLQGTSTTASPSAVSLSNARLLTSPTGSGTGTSGGSITINGVPTSTEATPQAADVTISGSQITADPPGQGGSVTINGNTIGVQTSTLNVLGSAGGALKIGSLATTNLNLASSTTLVLGPGGTQSFIVGPGGTLVNNAKVEYPLGPPGGNSTPLDKLTPATLESLTTPPLAVNNGDSSAPTTPPAPIQATPTTTTDGQPLASAQLNLDTAAGFETLLPAAPSGGTSTGGTSSGSSTGATASAGSTGAVAPATTLSSTETRQSFVSGESQAQRNTADKLGLADAGSGEAPTPERLQGVMQGVRAWLRERERERRCRRNPDAKCRS
ncbi:MAG: YDG domain-containing protein, partial [Synechococcaceae cyanobacterium]|nr:YDG domain-containing protein [Synechococcaceae cyanobacterium]